jgi:hypothetical protein
LSINFSWKKKRIKIKKVKDIAKIAERAYNKDDICFLSVPGCDEDIVIRRDDSISSEAVTNYYPQLGVYEIALGKNKDNCVDETIHELSHIYRGHSMDRQLNMEDFIRQEIEAWLDSSFLVRSKNKNILASGQWLVGIGNKAMESYNENPGKVIKTMRKVVNNIEDLIISEREWGIIEMVLTK